MDERRQRDERPWGGWLVMALLGAALAFFCITRLKTAPLRGQQSAPDASAPAGQRSVGFELVFRFNILLPDRQAGADG